MTKYTFSISNDTLNGLADSTSLKTEIQASAIVTAFNHIGTAADVLEIWFNADLSNSDQTLLTSIVAAHKGIPTVQIDAKYDEDGNLVTAPNATLIGTGTWLVSDNICSSSLPSSDPTWAGGAPAIIGTTHSNGGIIVYEWVPSAGKKLYCLETQLILSTDVDLSSTACHFIGVNAGKSGDQNFDRTYTGECGRSGYRIQADGAYEDSQEKRFVWDYTKKGPPIILKSSKSGKITLTRSGTMSGTYAYVKIKVISLPE